MAVSFQTTVNYQPGAAVAGDFASTVAATVNAVVLAGPGGLVAGTGGLTVGQFAWVQADGVTALATGTGMPSGFLSRQDMLALITTYGAGFGALVPAGYGVTLYNGGDFWASTTTTATVGQKVFASLTASTIATGTAGGTVTGFAETMFYVASAGAANTLIKISSRIP
jgi:hypothetical protein